MVINQYDIFWVDLNPTIGHEIKKVRPCVILSPDEMNLNIDTIIIAPMTTKSRSYPTRVKVTFKKKLGWIVLDQIRTIDKIRLKEKAGYLKETEITEVKSILKEMLID
jgi:mRNA interferase MazF